MNIEGRKYERASQGEVQWSNQENEFMYDPMEHDDRLGFIRKVYGILATQLVFTAAFCGFCMTQADNKSFVGVMTNPAIYFTVIFFYIATICALACCGQDTKVPTNYVLLSIFTFCVSWMVGVTCMFVKD